MFNMNILTASANMHPPNAGCIEFLLPIFTEMFKRVHNTSHQPNLIKMITEYLVKFVYDYHLNMNAVYQNNRQATIKFRL